jgi:predicted short-subunit dehydrogenase-like oxidoreductase (DUF2520 family)
MHPFPHIAIYGLGRFGRALHDSVTVLGIPARGGGRQTGPAALLQGLPPGSLVMLSVPDDSISMVATEFAALANAGSHAYVHACGAYGAALLQPLAQAGAATGAFHILQSFPAQGGASRVAGSWCAIDAPPSLHEKLFALAKALGTHPFTLPESARAAYHAAAVVASNALVALQGLAQQIAAEGGIQPDAAGSMLLPLVRGTLANVEAHGVAASLTGPVARGDADTLRRHLGAMGGEAAVSYRAALELTIQFALDAGRISAAQAASLRAALT